MPRNLNLFSVVNICPSYVMVSAAVFLPPLLNVIVRVLFLLIAQVVNLSNSTWSAFLEADARTVSLV